MDEVLEPFVEAFDAPEVPRPEPVPTQPDCEGEGRVLTYTLVYDREGAPEQEGEDCAVPRLGDPGLTAALMQQGAHFEGHLALSQGAIITGLIWGAIVASVIDGNFKNAGGFSLVSAVMASIGVIHSASLHIPEFNGIVIGYLIMGVFLLAYPMLTKVEKLDDAAESDSG